MFCRGCLAAIVAIAAVAAISAIAPAAAQPSGGGQGGFGAGMMGSGMMGAGGMMMGGGSNRPIGADWRGGVLDYRQVEAYLGEGDQNGISDSAAKTVTFSGRTVSIDLVAVQPGHDDQTFEVHGLTNPTLIVPQGAIVHFRLVNMDYGNDMEHGIILTPAPPPYPYMSMMATGPGLAQGMPLLPWRSAEAVQRARYATLETTFVADAPGTYWYVCPTPKHAEQGMYGKFVVQ